MSSKMESDDSKEQKINKKVDLVLYLNTEEGETRRQFADRIDPEEDYFEKRQRKRSEEKFRLVTPDSEIEIDGDEYYKLEGLDLGDARAVHERNEWTEREWVHNPATPLSDRVNNVFEKLLPEDGEWPFDFEKSFWNYRIDRSDGDYAFRINTWFERMPMLKHQSEITAEDMYVDEDEEYLAVKVKIKYRDVTREELEWLDDNITGPMMTQLGRADWVDRVRTFDCEMETKEEGVCFNI